MLTLDLGALACAAMFAWRYLSEDGGELGTSERFADRDAAESWIGETWADLLERGVDEVVLMDESAGRRVFRMGLRPE